MATKGTPPAPAASAPKNFSEALENAPAEVETYQEGAEEGDESEALDPEQHDCAERMGMDETEAKALRQFIRSVR